jgi:hypothetical protein
MLKSGVKKFGGSTQVAWWSFRYYVCGELETAFVSCYIRMRVITQNELRVIDRRVYVRRNK